MVFGACDRMHVATGSAVERSRQIGFGFNRATQ
ncbi:MAG: hypothetical protein ACK57V_05215 [Pirellula sp.]